MMKEFEYLVFDLDGTLLNKSKKISDLNKATIERAKYKGYKIILATSRHLTECEMYRRELFLDNQDYIISADGARINRGDGSLIFVHTGMQYEEVRDLFYDVRPMQFEVITNESDYIYDRRIIRKAYHFFHNSNRIVPLWNIGRVKKIHDPIEKIIIPNLYGDLLHDKIIGNYNSYLESKKLNIFSSSQDKSIAVRQILDIKGIGINNILYFGDGLNDYLSFMRFPNCVAMGNACNEILKIAKYVTKGNDDDGVAYALDFVLDGGIENMR